MPRSESWDISAQLRDLLAMKRWSQKKLAEKAGIQRTDINRMAAKENTLKAGLTRATRIAEALEVTVLDLGLPPEEAGEEAQGVLDRLEELAGDLSEAVQKQAKTNRQVARLRQQISQIQARVSTLEARPWPVEDQSTGQDGG